MSHQIPETVKDPDLWSTKHPDPLPRVWPHLTLRQRQQLAQHLADLIQRYRQPPRQEDNHDQP
jgi:hypothetical protein